MEAMAAELKIEDISSVKKKLSFEVLWADVKNELDKSYKIVGRNASIKGFRKGKVPRNVLEIHYSRQVEEEAISSLINRHYSEAVEKNNIMSVAQPVIDQKGITTDEDFLFDATVEIQPVVDPRDYAGLDLEMEELGISDVDIEERLNKIREMYSTLEDITDDRSLVNDDFAVIDFEGKLDGEARKELASKDYALQIGSGSFVPGFEEQLVGMNKGESRDITVTFPEEYGAKDIAGKSVLFSVTLKNIREKILPDLNEEFIKNFEKFESLKDLKEDVRKSLEEEGEARIKADFREAMIDKLLENNEFEVPSVWVEQQVYSMMLNARQRMVQNGMPDDKASEISYNLHDGFKDPATRIAKASFIFCEIAKKESIEVTEKDVEDRLNVLAEKYTQDYETVKKAYEANNMSDKFKDELLEQKAMSFIQEKANITFVKKDTEKGEG